MKFQGKLRFNWMTGVGLPKKLRKVAAKRVALLLRNLPEQTGRTEKVREPVRNLSGQRVALTFDLARGGHRIALRRVAMISCAITE